MSPCHGEDRGFEPRRDRQFVCMCSSVVEHQPSKLIMRVRFPSHAPFYYQDSVEKWHFFCFQYSCRDNYKSIIYLR